MLAAVGVHVGVSATYGAGAAVGAAATLGTVGIVTGGIGIAAGVGFAAYGICQMPEIANSNMLSQGLAMPQVLAWLSQGR